MDIDEFSRTTRATLGRLPIRWRWTVHNMVGHPLAELVYQLGAASISRWVHDVTLPDPVGEDARE